MAFLIGGPAATPVRALLRAGETAVATINLVETTYVSRRTHGLPAAHAIRSIDVLLEGPLTAIALDVPIACRAAELRTAHYHRTSCPISLADSVLLATARPGDAVATADPDVLAVARAEGIGAIELPGQG